ncbi:trypsin-like peptidase domain-containing protein [Verrucomicrobiales bacterium]|nr:trypsin-like peptidase domain-containing protein [Verrucomicrobiales bacterium]
MSDRETPERRTLWGGAAARLAAQLMPLPALAAFFLGLSDAVRRTVDPVEGAGAPAGERTLFASPRIHKFAEVERAVGARLAAAEAATVRLEVKHSGLAKIAGSGVIVSSEGLVLTAGHNIEGATGGTEVFLADGRTRKAVVLGYDHDSDTGVLQILTEGQERFPFAEIRDEDRMLAGAWCFALGHPGGSDEGRGVVLRVGQVVATSESIIRTTCKLASGDSGGPLFDLKGRVAAVHSRITEDITENFHIRTPVFVATWTDLAPGSMLPAIADRDEPSETRGNEMLVSQTGNAVPVSAVVSGDFKTTDEEFDLAVARARASTVSIEDAMRGERLCLGTAIAPAVVVTKASTINGTAELQVRFANGQTTPAFLVAGEETNDLAYLRLAHPAPSYIRPFKDEGATATRRGRFVVTPLPHSDSPLGYESGTIASNPRDIARARGLLGIKFVLGPDRVVEREIEKIYPGSIAQDAGMMPGDTIISVGGQKVRTGAQAKAAIGAYYPGETVAIQVLREGVAHLLHPRMTSDHKIDSSGLDPHFERAAVIDGPTSWRQTGFTQVTQHDIALRPDQMGTPLLDLKGRFIALSIARVDRVTTLALPSSAIQQPPRL